MTRPLRITYPGAIYHIINRGCRRDKIFRRISDREEFLARLTAASSKYGIIIHGYCLMDNHFHLLVETPNENLSAFMQLLQCGYANWFKARYKLVGPLFQSRFKSVLVEDESYLVTLSAYIHLNPVRAGMINNPDVYRWSSCKLYFRNEADELIDPAMVLEYAGGVDNYKFILNEMIGGSPPPEAIYGKFSILGKASFVEKVARQIDDTKIDIKAVPQLKKIITTTPEKIALAVREIMNVTNEQMIAKTQGNTARKLYIYLLKKRTVLTLREISKFAGMNYRSAGELARRFEREFKRSKELRKIVEKTEEFINGE